MIRATIRRGADSATMTWTPEKEIQLEGHPELCAHVDHAIRPGAKAVYNPHLGGLYRGFDRTHPVQVADALQELPKLVPGASVEMHQNDHQPEGPPPAWASSDGHNWLDQGYAESLRPGPMDPSVRRVVFDPQGRVIHLPEPPAPPPESVTVQAYTRQTRRGAQQVQQHQRRRHKLGKSDSAAALLGLLWFLAKAKSWKREGVEQLGLFGAPRAPAAATADPVASPPAPPTPAEVATPSPPPTPPALVRPPRPASQGMTADQRKEALSAARRVLADPTSPAEQLHQALRALPPDGSKAAELREQLQARLGRPAEPTSPAPTPSKPSPSPGPAPVKQALPPAAADATASGTASGHPSGDAERSARPPGQGWEQVPGTRHNGWRRRHGIGQGYEYWYPTTSHARADQHEVAGEDKAGARLYAETKGYHPDHLHPEPQKLAAKAREKGEKLLAEGAELSGRTYASSSRTASENAANAHARGAEATALGRRLVRFADRVEQEGYQPTHFDAAMLETRPREAARMLQRRAERHAESLAEVARYGPSPSRSVHGADTDHVYVRAPTDLMPYKTPEATQNAVKRAIAGYERVLAKVSGDSDRGAGHVRATADNIEALQAAHAKLAPHRNFLGQNKGDGHLDLLAHQRIGFIGAGDRAAVVERYKRWKADNGSAQEAPRSAAPDRSGARDPFETRLARAEAEERRRFIPQTMQGIPSFFETPPPVVERMIEEADIQPGMSVLEPSAGRGGIADRLPGDVSITVAERSSTLQDELRRKGYQPLADGLNVAGTFDRIVMNPPFEANADIEHVRHAFDRNLKPGGRLVAIVGAGAFQRQGKKEGAFRDWLDTQGASYEPLPDDTFKRSGTLARSYLVVVDKRRDAVQMAAKASSGLARALRLVLGTRGPASRAAAPEALHKGLLVALVKAERGEATPEMTWEQDGATCSVVLTAGGARVLTIRHPRLALPYHLLVPSASEARAACARALPVLLSGRTPPEGMFRQVGRLPVGGLKGYAVHA